MIYKKYDSQLMDFVELKISKEITFKGEVWGLLGKNPYPHSSYGFLHKNTGLWIGAIATRKNAMDVLTSRITEIGVEKVAELVASLPTNEQAYQINLERKAKFDALDEKMNFVLCEDYFAAYLGRRYKVDIIYLDKYFSRNDPDYNGEKSIYKGKNVSLREYIVIKYGEEISDLVAELI